MDIKFDEFLNLMNAHNVLLVLQRCKGHAMTAQSLKSFVYPSDLQTVRNTISLLRDVGAPIEHTGAVQGSWALLDGKEYIAGLELAKKQLEERISKAKSFN